MIILCLAAVASPHVKKQEKLGIGEKHYLYVIEGTLLKVRYGR